MFKGFFSWHWLWLIPLLAVTLSPGCFALVQAVASAVEGPSWLEKADFGRVFNRVLMISGVLVGIPLLWNRGYRRLKAFGFESGFQFWNRFGQGFLIGAGCLVILWISHWGIGIRIWNWELTIGKLLGIIITALLVSIFEEALFRGVLVKELSRFGVVWVIGIQAVVFSLLHFTSSPDFEMNYVVKWWSGLELMSRWTEPFQQEPNLMLRGLVLVMLGVVLGTGAWIFGGIGWCIGMHAVLIIGIKITPLIFDYHKGPWKRWIPGNLSDGWDCLIVLLAVEIILLYYGGKRKSGRFLVSSF